MKGLQDASLVEAAAWSTPSCSNSRAGKNAHSAPPLLLSGSCKSLAGASAANSAGANMLEFAAAAHSETERSPMPVPQVRWRSLSRTAADCTIAVELRIIASLLKSLQL